MYTVSHDYYAILGVSKNATTEEISEQYKKLMKEHHPDQFKGMRAKYQSEGDQDLLKVIDEKIRRAEEMCKLLNEAFEVLSDPLKRKQYDDQAVEPSVPLPEISVHPTRITFGSLTEGQKKSLGFTVENKGGPPATVNVDWEGNKPDWGELVIEPDEEKVFPIKVTVKVDTTGIPSGPKDEKILVDVDGRIHMVEVFLAVTRPVAASAAPARTPTRTYSPYPSAAPSPTPPIKTNNTIPVVLGAILVFGLMVVWGIADNASRQARVKAIETANQQQQEEQQQLATQVARLSQELPSLVQISNVSRIKCKDVLENCLYENWVYIRFKVTNNSGVDIWIEDPAGYFVPIGPDTPGDGKTLEAGQTQEYVTDDVTCGVGDNEKLVQRNGFENYITFKLCLNFIVRDPFEYNDVGSVTTCADIPDELASQ